MWRKLGCLLIVLSTLTCFVLLIAFYSQIIRPPRPMFANSYGLNDRPPWPQWWFSTPIRDYSGHVSIRGDHEFNVLLVVVTDGRNQELEMAWGPVVDDNGRLLMHDGFDLFVAPNSPDLRSKRNCLVIVTPEYDLHEFPVPAEFAKAFEERVESSSGSKNPLRWLQRFGRTKGVPEVAKWIDDNVPGAWLDEPESRRTRPVERQDGWHSGSRER